MKKDIFLDLRLRGLYIFFILFLMLVSVAIAQTWDLGGVKGGGRVYAEITGLDDGQQVINARFYTNRQAGQYKMGYCQANDFTQIKKDGKKVKFSALKEGDVIYVEVSILENERRVCNYVEVIRE